MFKKVLVAEDMDSINIAVAAVLKDLGIEQVEHAQYCDKARILAKQALSTGEPFDLLICDLSFKNDHRTENIKSGKELISVLKQEDPNLRVLINSVEDHPQTVRSLWDSGNIDAYVCKDRRGLKDLEEAILALTRGEAYNSKGIENVLNRDNILMLKDWDMELLTAIATGLTQEEIQDSFKKRDISPNSKSSIEKRLKELREEFAANTTPHLIGILKDLKIL
ncbi:MAG: response regulator [Salinimicrobium sediminis]|nr:response regulator [Salinimicrobium sediminis]